MKWATCNIGASSPEEYGSYYAWGETEEKDNYEWTTYKYCNGSHNTLTKYCTVRSHGIVDNKTVLELEDDVAHMKWGGSWRMPTIDEFRELLNNCLWKRTTKNGVEGCIITSQTTGNSIFLPAAGFHWSELVRDSNSLGYYSSASLYNDGSSYVYGINFDNVGWSFYFGRSHGFSVRPVTE